jgi:hypothetical protein
VPLDWAALDTSSGNFALLLGQRVRRIHLEARRLKDVKRDVSQRLRAICGDTVRNLEAMEARDYFGNPELEENEEYFVIDRTTHVARAEVPDQAEDGTTDIGQAEAAAQSDLQRLVANAWSHDDIGLTEIDSQFLFYAVVIDIDKEGPVGFVRKMNPRLRPKSGGFIAAIYADGVKTLEEVPLSFDGHFDVVVSRTSIAVLRQKAGISLFSDVNLIKETVPREVGALAAAMPLPFVKGGKDALVEACSERPSLAKRLQRVSRSDEIQKVTPETFRAALERHGLDIQKYLRGGYLVVPKEDVRTVLDVLESVYYETDFASEPRRADRYSRRPSRTGKVK